MISIYDYTYIYNAPMKNGVGNTISGHLEGMKSQKVPGLWGASRFARLLITRLTAFSSLKILNMEFCVFFQIISKPTYTRNVPNETKFPSCIPFSFK